MHLISVNFQGIKAEVNLIFRGRSMWSWSWLAPYLSFCESVCFEQTHINKSPKLQTSRSAINRFNQTFVSNNNNNNTFIILIPTRRLKWVRASQLLLNITV